MNLKAGTPNDANRDYVPLDIPGTDMTVNENGNNSQVYPERLRRFSEVLADGLTDCWYEYVPESYDGSKAVPLIVSNHGGLMNGWAQAVYSSWTLLSEREGFLCVFPDAHELQMWMLQGMAAKVRANPELVLPIPADPEDWHDNHDIRFVRALIERMKEKYNIDPGRIYMHGMSMGHMMTDQFARFHGDILAGASGSGAGCMESQLYEADGTVRNWGGPVPMWISHPELNGMDGPREQENAQQQMSRAYWSQINGVRSLPEIRIIGEDNFAFYHGDKADLVWLDIKNRDHGQTLDEAYLIWNYLFSGRRRLPDGTIAREPGRLSMEGDAHALAFAAGCRKVWRRGAPKELPAAPVLWDKLKYHGLEGGHMVRGQYLCVPLRYLAEVFGSSYETNAEGTEATVTLRDGRCAQFARGVIGCLVDGELVSMYCETLQREGELLVSVEWFCRWFFNGNVSVCNGVAYVTDHFAELSAFMAELIRELLSDRPAGKEEGKT